MFSILFDMSYKFNWGKKTAKKSHQNTFQKVISNCIFKKFQTATFSGIENNS